MPEEIDGVADGFLNAQFGNALNESFHKMLQTGNYLQMVGASSYTEAPTSVKRLTGEGKQLAERVTGCRPRYEKVNLRNQKAEAQKTTPTSSISELMGMLNTMRTGQMVEINIVYRSSVITAAKEADVTILTKKKSDSEIIIIKLAPYFVAGENREILVARYEGMELQDYARYVMAKVRPDMKAFPHLLSELEDIGLAYIIPTSYPRDARSLRELLGKVAVNRLDAADKFAESLDFMMDSKLMKKTHQVSADVDISEFI